MRIAYRQRNRFRNYLSIMAFVIIGVLLSFKMIPDKKMASLLASFLFIASATGVLIYERRFPGFQKRPSFWGVLAFLVFSALPILAVRLIYWDMNFEDIEVFGITGSLMHKASNNVFIVMMVCFFADAFMETSRQREQAQREELEARRQ